MQAHSFFIGGIPMIFYGDELGCLNDYSFLNDAGKSYDNRWMHRPVTDWEKNKNIDIEETIENIVFSSTQKLISLRKRFSAIADHNNLKWLTLHNIHAAGYVRAHRRQKLYCLYNFSNQDAFITWLTFKEDGEISVQLYDHWNDKQYMVGHDHEHLILEPYSFCLLATKEI